MFSHIIGYNFEFGVHPPKYLSYLVQTLLVLVLVFQNGSICMEEFVCGLAIVLHGSFKDRCSLLFSIFNLGNDEGVSRAELRTMLTAILQSTNTILYTVGYQDSAVLGSQDMNATVDVMVESAFMNCDISRTGKLLPKVSELAIGVIFITRITDV